MTSNATYHQLSPGSQDGEDDRQADDAPLLGEDVTERDPDFVLHADEVEMSVLTSEGRNAEPDLETGQSSSRTARPSPRDRVTNWWSRAPVPTRLGSAALGVLGCLSLTLPSLIEMLDKTQVTVIVPAEYNTIQVDSNYNQDHLTWNTERKGQSLVRHFELPRSRGHEVEVTVEDAEGNKIEVGNDDLEIRSPMICTDEVVDSSVLLSRRVFGARRPNLISLSNSCNSHHSSR
jgi:hypothetical protein